MDSNDAADVIMTVIHSDNPHLSKGDEVETVDGDSKHNNDNSKHEIAAHEGQDEKDNGEDQDSVIIEEAQNKTIDLNEDSEEEIELIIEKSSSDLPNSPTKATEFVIVNAANLSTTVVNEAESTKNAVEDIQIKDELSESITADLNTNDVLENDPMDLLELNNRSESTGSVRSQEETDYVDDASSVGSSSAQTGSSSSVSVHDWIKDYPWLLYEEGDEPLGYCLYCDVKINTKSQRFVKQHGLSLYHKERCENYLAFREEEEKNGLGMKLVEIKEEFGTDSRVEALKLKRKSQSVALNNFNWRRWLQDYPWLERDSAEGTVGFCKYCLVHVNIEFSYLRDRHQEATKHRDAEKQYEVSNEPGEKMASSIEDKDKDSIVNSQPKSHKWLELLEKEPAMARCKVCGSKMFKNNFLRHLGTKLHESNEKVYLQNLNSEKQEEIDEEPGKNQNDWKLLTKQHPWIVTDPENATFAFCKYCEKRICYGSSASKRAMHEKSLQHKQNEIEFKNRSRNHKTDKKNTEDAAEEEQNDEEKDSERDNEGEENGDEDQNDEKVEKNEDDVDDEEDNESENEDKDDEEEEEGEEEDADNEEEEGKEKETEDENEPKRRVYNRKLTDEWLSEYPWCKRYKKDPTNFMYCIYCRIPLSASYSRTKHQNTSFHISSEKEFLSRQDKKQKVQVRKQNNDNQPFYEWATPLRNSPNSYSCIYCRVRISKNYSKKQHAASKIHQINENIYKNNSRTSSRKDDNTNTDISEQTSKGITTQHSNIATTKKAFAKVVIKAPSTVSLVKQYQKKFTWLSYKRSELRNHYGHCKICDSSLYIRSLKHVLRHVRSGRHVSIMKAKKKQTERSENANESEMNDKTISKVSKEEMQTSPTPSDNSSQNRGKIQNVLTAEKGASATQELESQKGYSYKSTLAEMKKRFSWIEKSNRPNYAFCRFCNSNIPLKILFLKNHSNSHKHRHCVINYYSADGQRLLRRSRGPNNVESDINDGKSVDGENDVIVVEDNNEEILISEQDENWTIKSETMDEHEELDYLLQRSFNSTLNTSNVQRNVRKSVNIGDEQPPKRIKRSQSFRRLNDSNSSLVASLLTTPLTLASCLGPLIQQQIQQQANLSQTQNTVSITPAPEVAKEPTTLIIEPENTYDLFFKSVSETMKKLPTDLAAEGKLRVMQVICDLELQALKREQSARGESVSSNASGGLNYQTASTPPVVNPVCNSSVISDITAEPNGNCNETIITQLNLNTEASPPSATNILPSKATHPNTVDKPSTSCASSPIIGVMDKNGLQTLQFKTSASKPIQRNTPTTTITSVANSGIRCIPFKNLSQPVTPEPSNQKITRIQVPINVQTPPNPNTVNTSKNLLNFRNIQITKRIGTAPTSVTPTTVSQQNVQKTPTMTNKGPQRAFITNIQPQLQRWGCSVNGSTPHQTPPSNTVNHLQQLSQHTSTPISKK